MAKKNTTRSLSCLYGKNVNEQADKPTRHHQSPHDAVSVHQFCDGWYFHSHQFSQDFLICFQAHHFWTVIILKKGGGDKRSNQYRRVTQYTISCMMQHKQVALSVSFLYTWFHLCISQNNSSLRVMAQPAKEKGSFSRISLLRGVKPIALNSNLAKYAIFFLLNKHMFQVCKHTMDQQRIQSNSGYGEFPQCIWLSVNLSIPVIWSCRKVQVHDVFKDKQEATKVQGIRSKA